jgi:hypothetical protein
MSGIRNSALGSAIAALIPLSPIVAFLMILAAEMLIDLLIEVGATADCALAAGAIGWVLYRKYWPHPNAPQWGREQEPDEAAIASPQM